MKKIKIFMVVVTMLLIGISKILFAEGIDFDNSSKHRIGFITGFSSKNMDQLAMGISYDYEVLFSQFQFYWQFFHKRNWALDLLFQPQYNLTSYRYIDSASERNVGFEVGVNAGVLIRKTIHKDSVHIYALVSSGPHYVSGAPRRQSNGFIFSDNLFLGLTLKLFKGTYLDLRPGFRHISNAGLKRPNGGVNNIVFSGGILINPK